MRKLAALFCCILCCQSLTAQVLGGKSVFPFLDLPAAPQITALGSMNVSQQNTSDLSLAMGNPALLRPSMHAHLQANYTSYFADVKYGHCMLGYDATGIQTTFAASVQYVHYGTLTQTDAAGNVQGAFSPRDIAWQLTASRQYLERWHYGVNLKFIQSRYQQYSAAGLAADVGITYQDTAHQLQIGLTARNMGVQLRTYVTGGGQEPLPFDLQVGISKRLQHLPLQLSATLHHLYQFDVRYADPAMEDGIVISDGDTTGAGGKTVDKLFRHMVLAAQYEVGRYVELTVSYNHLRRQELAVSGQQGLSGFAAGIGIITKKLQLRYARSWYQRANAFNQLGINIPLQQWGLLVKE
ncbi:type IX secretion system protein PorQ [Chitinophaga agrisoli]|uniref:Type IX secretion system protein PorQ n=1 Tax=Chitinophaga agrisoli TaxID=2607653 RepID=A0A5B2VQD8_9BACT|nr:type IX secretion system protein PorQ [Chitinophaga agrisoli]KAA2241983.1 type IX secretion system protein PorQ [Chitinophaga agrisoli]